MLQLPPLLSYPPTGFSACSAKLQVRAQTQQRRTQRSVVVAAADNRAAAGFAAAALAAAVLVNAPMAKADLVSSSWELAVGGHSTANEQATVVTPPLPTVPSWRRHTKLLGTCWGLELFWRCGRRAAKNHSLPQTVRHFLYTAVHRFS